MTVPAEAQISPDGYYWFDEQSGEWQPVPEEERADVQARAGGGGAPQTIPGGSDPAPVDDEPKAPIDWSSAPTLYHLLSAQTLQEGLANQGVDSAALQGEAGESCRPIEHEIQAIQQTIGGSPASADPAQVCQVLQGGVAGQPLTDVLREVVEHLRQSGEGAVDQVEHVLQAAMHEIEQLIHTHGAGS